MKRPPLDLRTPPPGLANRFWSKVDRRGPDECWPWTAYRIRSGYGLFALRKGVFVTGSRMALALSGVVIQPDQQACHKCDNPPCCNPAHLFACTASENLRDCRAKGRYRAAAGEDHPKARLDEAAVRAIRATVILPGTKTQLARQYGVSLEAVRSVLNGRTWKHLLEDAG